MSCLDLVLVDYGQGNKEICEAPPWRLSVGDRVVTDFGIGVVVEDITISDEDSTYKLFSKIRKLKRVNSILRDLEYEDDDI